MRATRVQCASPVTVGSLKARKAVSSESKPSQPGGVRDDVIGGAEQVLVHFPGGEPKVLGQLMTLLSYISSGRTREQYMIQPVICWYRLILSASRI